MDYDEKRSIALAAFARVVRRARFCEEFRHLTTDEDLKRRRAAKQNADGTIATPLDTTMAFLIGSTMISSNKTLWKTAYDLALIRWG